MIFHNSDACPNDDMNSQMFHALIFGSKLYHYIHCSSLNYLK